MWTQLSSILFSLNQIIKVSSCFLIAYPFQLPIPTCTAGMPRHCNWEQLQSFVRTVCYLSYQNAEVPCYIHIGLWHVNMCLPVWMDMNRYVQGILHDNITTSDRNPKCTVVKNYPLPLIFRWFKFTLKPPYSITHDNLRLAIWDTSFWTFWLKFGHKGPWDIS